MAHEVRHQAFLLQQLPILAGKVQASLRNLLVGDNPTRRNHFESYLLICALKKAGINRSKRWQITLILIAGSQATDRIQSIEIVQGAW